MGAALERELETGDLDLNLSLFGLQMGRRDPTMQQRRGYAVRAWNTPEGPGTLELGQRAGRCLARAWGSGASWLLERAAALTGQADQPEQFDAGSGLVGRLAHDHRGLRLVQTPLRFDVACSYVLQQRVTYGEAVRSYQRLVTERPAEAPGPYGLLLPPTPESLMKRSAESYRHAGLDRQRAAALREVSARASRLERADHDQVVQLLSRIRGVGPWTTQQVLGHALGHADAVPVGDVHLPHMVAWALAQEERADDERMLQLLEPYRGHRFRVIRLLFAAGFEAPRRGPKRTPRQF